VPPTLDDDVVDLCATLIRFDTSNFGGNDAHAERPAAEWVATRLSDAGYDPQVLESSPGRASTVVRIPGRDRSAPGLLAHGHLDVVPVDAADWQRDPFLGEVVDDPVSGPSVWGRGALDMKDMDAMLLAVVLGFARDGFVPPRDLVLAFVADEEDTGGYGAGFLVAEHPELFEGVTAAIGESGGHRTVLPNGAHLYPVATCERGTAWMRLTARGPAGHGSRPAPRNAVATLSRAVARIADQQWPTRLIPAVRALLDGVAAELGLPADADDPDALAAMGEIAGLITRTARNSLNPTMLQAGYKANVIPGEATAVVDGRVLPGTEDKFFATVDELLGPDVTREFVSFTRPVGAGHETAEFAAIGAAIRSWDPGAIVLPYCLGGGTDAKAFSTLGINCYGFAPGVFPPGFTAGDYVHGIDERVPISSLHAGVRMVDAYLRSDPYLTEEQS
jgi:acetylornithine deacetylase/succinyl-diaminopimelate desuccinylase-like protein